MRNIQLNKTFKKAEDFFLKYLYFKIIFLTILFLCIIFKQINLKQELYVYFIIGIAKF